MGALLRILEGNQPSMLPISQECQVYEGGRNRRNAPWTRPTDRNEFSVGEYIGNKFSHPFTMGTSNAIFTKGLIPFSESEVSNSQRTEGYLYVSDGKFVRTWCPSCPPLPADAVRAGAARSSFGPLDVGRRVPGGRGLAVAGHHRLAAVD